VASAIAECSLWSGKARDIDISVWGYDSFGKKKRESVRIGELEKNLYNFERRMTDINIIGHTTLNELN
jgi:hypothetical protein